MLAKLKLAIQRAAAAIKAHVYHLLLAVFPFTDQIVAFVSDNLPVLAPYLPANVYKWMGLAVVLAKALYDLRAIKRAKGA